MLHVFVSGGVFSVKIVTFSRMVVFTRQRVHKFSQVVVCTL
jgi:hypothetical protein